MCCSGPWTGRSEFCNVSVFCFLMAILVLPLATRAQPLNDNFRNRVVITGGNATVSGSLSNATFETGEPFIPGISSGQTAWWTWTAPSNGIVTVSATGTNFFPLLTIYTGNDLSSLSLLASNNYLACYESTNCGCHWRERNQITFHVAHEQVYQIAVDSAVITDASWIFQQIPMTNPVPRGAVWAFAQAVGYSSFYLPVLRTNILTGGGAQLGFQFTPAPTNDDFEKRVPLIGSRTRLFASNAGATKQPGEPDHLGNPGGSSVWYSWPAPTSGRVTLSTNNIPPYLPPSWSGSYGLRVETIFGDPGSPTCGNEIDQHPPPAFGHGHGHGAVYFAQGAVVSAAHGQAGSTCR